MITSLQLYETLKKKYSPQVVSDKKKKSPFWKLFSKCYHLENQICIHFHDKRWWAQPGTLGSTCLLYGWQSTGRGWCPEAVESAPCRSSTAAWTWACSGRPCWATWIWRAPTSSAMLWACDFHWTVRLGRNSLISPFFLNSNTIILKQVGKVLIKKTNLKDVY